MAGTGASKAIAKEPLTAALIEQWRVIGTLLPELTDAQWASATPLPGWRVQDVVAHIVGTELMLSGVDTPASADDLSQLEHVRNRVGLHVERWVAAFRGCTSQQVLAKYREITAHRAGVLEAMTQSDFDAPTETLSGPFPYGRFMRVRLFDCWFHEHDIRDAVGIAGDETGQAAEYALTELLEPSGPGIRDEGGLGYVIGERAKAPRGSIVTFELVGPITADVHVAVDSRAVVEKPDRPSTVTIRLPSTVFTRLCGGRTRAVDHWDRIAIRGDDELGRRVLADMAYTI
ncbi:maleylpyruvate isomerase family mycothiol-dependent enzyme [Rhodococcus sp. WMMA185]|uniref:maleylpyruvate isomerase family mycothiol-dependent enzyme n=1 Tax=Rhodococcus sp. WMMA185 TaxID=679318 RepID=UPI001E2EE71E|nr:maleylpyruvate isomerase family mycothiol-dependent enzyme [Rhodococcus sp. WMMA185]